MDKGKIIQADSNTRTTSATKLAALKLPGIFRFTPLGVVPASGVVLPASPVVLPASGETRTTTRRVIAGSISSTLAGRYHITETGGRAVSSR